MKTNQSKSTNQNHPIKINKSKATNQPINQSRATNPIKNYSHQSTSIAGGPSGWGATVASRRGRDIFQWLAQACPRGYGAVSDDCAGGVGQGQLPAPDPTLLA